MAASMTVRELLTRYSFKADTKPLKRIDNAVNGLKTRMAALDQKIIGAFTGLAKAATVAAAGVSVAIVKMGSDAEESEAKFSAVFGDQEKTVRQWSETVGKSMGRSTFKMREFAASLQDTFVPLGFARDTAAQMSMNLVELSEDVASFQNKASPEVMADFQSALVGNHETVRKYGIIITQARLDKKIAAMKKEMPGFIRLSKEQQKVLARQKLIFEGTSDAQGDAHRTAGSFANQMKRLRALAEDTAKKVGMKLLPVITAWVKKAGDWIDKNNELIQQKVQEFLEGVIEAFRALGRVIKWIIDNWRTLATVLGLLVGGRILFGIASMVKSFWDLASAVTSVISGGKGLGAVIGGAITKAGGLAAALGKVGAVGAALGVGWAIGTYLDRWLGLSDKMIENLRAVDRRMSKARQPVLDVAAAHRSLADQAKRYAELSARGVKTITTRSGEKIALTQENIQKQLQAAAQRMGYAKGQIGADFAANILRNVPQAAAEAPAGSAFAGAQAKGASVRVDSPKVDINMPPGTTADQARKLGEESSAALMASLRRAMGDVQR